MGVQKGRGAIPAAPNWVRALSNALEAPCCAPPRKRDGGLTLLAPAPLLTYGTAASHASALKGWGR